MKDLGDLHYFLGIEVIRTPEDILISQCHYVFSMLFKFDMTECKSISTPRDRNVKLRPNSRMACDPKRFRQIVGSLIYLTITQSDLNYRVRLISQIMVHLTLEHLECMHRILMYVGGTKDRELLYRTGVAGQLVSYTDTDWARNAGDRRSTSEYVFSLGSVTIAWSSKKQQTLALSSTEADY